MKIKKMPAKYINALTHQALSKNAPAKSAITGILAPQGINGASITVAMRSLSFLIVLLAIIPGTVQPTEITKGITDFPDRPTFLKIGSKTTDALAMYPQSSNKEIRKYINQNITIPRFRTDNKPESLNASIATAIIISEILKTK